MALQQEKEILLSDVMINLGREIGEAIKVICRKNFGKYVQVTIGGYGNGDLDEDAAPFVWVSPIDQGIRVVGSAITEFAVRVVVGIAPKKDIPNPGSLITHLANLAEKETDASVLATRLAQEIPDYLYREEREQAIAAAASAAEKAALVWEKANACQDYFKNGSVDDALVVVSDGVSAGLQGATLLTQVTTIARSTGWEEILPLIEETETKVASVTAQATTVTQARQSYMQDVAAYEDCPYIVYENAKRTDSHNGLKIYGAITIFDDIRKKMIEVIQSGRFGMPVTSVEFKGNEQSAFPLDWTEAHVVFGVPERL